MIDPLALLDKVMAAPMEARAKLDGRITDGREKAGQVEPRVPKDLLSTNPFGAAAYLNGMAPELVDSSGSVAGLSHLESPEYLKGIRELGSMNRAQFQRFGGLWARHMNALVNGVAVARVNKTVLDALNEGLARGQRVILPNELQWGNEVQRQAYSLIEADARLTGMPLLLRPIEGGKKLPASFTGIALERKVKGATGGRLDGTLYGGQNGAYNLGFDIGTTDKPQQLTARPHYVTPGTAQEVTPIIYERVRGYDQLKAAAAEISKASALRAAAFAGVNRIRQMTTQQRAALASGAAYLSSVAVSALQAASLSASVQRTAREKILEALKEMQNDESNCLVTMFILSSRRQELGRPTSGVTFAKVNRVEASSRAEVIREYADKYAESDRLYPLGLAQPFERWDKVSVLIRQDQTYESWLDSWVVPPPTERPLPPGILND
jgi:hypothetical protein